MRTAPDSRRMKLTKINLFLGRLDLVPDQSATIAQKRRQQLYQAVRLLNHCQSQRKPRQLVQLSETLYLLRRRKMK
jgi:hypothetical protein